MADPLCYVRGDRMPALELTLLDSAGNAIDLTGASVTLRLINAETETVKATKTATVSDASGGVITVQWSSGDLDTAGRFYAEVAITYAGGEVRTISDKLEIHVRSKV